MWTNICELGITEEYIKVINLQIQESQQNPSTRNIKKTTAEHVIIKLIKMLKMRKRLNQPEKSHIIHRKTKSRRTIYF